MLFSFCLSGWNFLALDKAIGFHFLPKEKALGIAKKVQEPNKLRLLVGLATKTEFRTCHRVAAVVSST
jgi:hypothetical protein